MDSLKSFLNSISPIEEETWLDILPLFIKKVFAKNQLLVRAGAISTEIFFLEEGVIRTFFKNDEREYTKAFDIPPTLTCGYASLITGQPNRINLEAMARTVVWKASYKDLIALYDRHPDLERVARLIAERSFVEKENRELEIGLLDATQRYRLFQNQFPGLEQKIPQYCIASYLGITPTQLSRIRASHK